MTQTVEELIAEGRKLADRLCEDFSVDQAKMVLCLCDAIFSEKARADRATAVANGLGDAHLDALRRMKERAEAADAKVETLDQVVADTAAELGCSPDNEAILQAIADLKAKLTVAKDRLESVCGVQARYYGDAMGLHMAMTDESANCRQALTTIRSQDNDSSNS